MNRAYTPPERPDEDRAYAEERQRQVDDEALAAQLAERDAKRAAAGISAEQLSMQDAFMEGQRAGRMMNGSSLNPYQSHTPEHAEWERGRHGAIGATLNGNR